MSKPTSNSAIISETNSTNLRQEITWPFDDLINTLVLDHQDFCLRQCAKVIFQISNFIACETCARAHCKNEKVIAIRSRHAYSTIPFITDCTCLYCDCVLVKVFSAENCHKCKHLSKTRFHTQRTTTKSAIIIYQNRKVIQCLH